MPMGSAFATSTRWVLLPTVIAWLGLHAETVQAQPHRVCLYLDIGDELWDASPRAADGEDFREEYGRNEGPTSYPAQRWLARVSDAMAGEDLFGWDPLDGGGCAAFELADADAELVVQWVRWATWESLRTGNQLIGYACDPSMGDCELEVLRARVPADVAGVTSVIVTGADLREVDFALWCASFAEERFASIGEQPLDDARIYVSYDALDILPGDTQADRTFGNQPSVILHGDTWHSKHTIAHELGHQQTIIAAHPSFGEADLDYCHDPALHPAAPSGCPPNHSMESHEWQATAAIEGIGHWYAVSVWNDVDLVECQNCQPGVRYVSPSSASDARWFRVPRGEPLCTAVGEPPCLAGVGNEWDWLSAFRLFRLSAAPSFRTMLTMLSAVYATGAWSPQAADASFWTSFDQAMIPHLGPNHAAWRAAAETMDLDR